jgi:hypothetical protein
MMMRIQRIQVVERMMIIQVSMKSRVRMMMVRR